MDGFFEKKEMKIKKWWEEYWQDMPEFIQEEKDSYAKIIIRFDKEEDLYNFARLINQKLSKNTKSIWYPKLERGKNLKRRWESDIKDNI